MFFNYWLPVKGSGYNVNHSTYIITKVVYIYILYTWDFERMNATANVVSNNITNNFENSENFGLSKVNSRSHLAIINQTQEMINNTKCWASVY